MTRTAAAAFILQPSDGRSIHLGGFQMAVTATSEQTSGATRFGWSLLPQFGQPEILEC